VLQKSTGCGCKRLHLIRPDGGDLVCHHLGPLLGEATVTVRPLVDLPCSMV